MRDAYIVSAVRTPIGVGKPGKGALHSVLPVDLAAQVLNEVTARAGIEPQHVEDVILGCVTPLGNQGGNIGRLAALQAGFPVTTTGVQINRMCGSSQQAVHFAAQAIMAGDMDLVIAGGIEMMSHEPLGSDYPAEWHPDFPYPLVHQGISAEMMAEKFHLTREALDDYAFLSHLKAGEAQTSGRLKAQMAPVTVHRPDTGEVVVAEDQGVRYPPDREKIAALSPVFKPDGVITAGNSSQISDGAAALLLVAEDAAARLDLEAIARIRARVVVGSDPVLMLDGPIPATRKALNSAGVKLKDLSAIEINEAFACVVLAWEQELAPDMSIVNADGGAIAHGHPLGATGAVLMTKLIDRLRRGGGGLGLQTMCIGHGMATATVLEAF